MLDTKLNDPPTRLLVPHRWLPLIAAYAILAVAIALVLPHVIPLKTSDYVYHVKLARIMAEHHVIVTPHFLYQLAVIVLQQIIKGPDYYLAALITTLACYWATAVALYHLMLNVLPPRRFGSHVLSVGIALGMTVAMPVALFAGLDRHHYLGYMAFGVYHNPTLVMLKPLALALFLAAVRGLNASSPLPAWFLAASATLAVLSTLAKPSYAICLLPALFVAAGFAWWRKRDVSWRLLVVLGGSLVLVLALQYWLTYSLAGNSSAAFLKEIGGGLTKSQILWMPFFVMSYWSKFLFGKFLLSILFPLTVLLAYGRRALRDPMLPFAWLCFAFGAAYAYLLAESGTRIVDGNFFWSGSTTLFILFTTSMIFLLRQRPGEQTSTTPREHLKYRLCQVMFWLHVAAGGYFYYLLLNARSALSVW
jgi:hypothetical protein